MGWCATARPCFEAVILEPFSAAPDGVAQRGPGLSRSTQEALASLVEAAKALPQQALERVTAQQAQLAAAASEVAAQHRALQV